MKTVVFKTYSDFLAREDKKINGVSPEFAEKHPDYEKQNETNIGCWNCSGCYDCYDCSRCYDCSGCSGCSDCSNIAHLSGKKSISGGKPSLKSVPVIENIHQKVLEAASKEGALNMAQWHTCETTHCRAGWVVTLAGKDGAKLEAKTSTMFAAMQIYKASSPIRVFPPRFFDTNKEAMADMKRCADEESKS